MGKFVGVPDFGNRIGSSACEVASFQITMVMEVASFNLR